MFGSPLWGYMSGVPSKLTQPVYSLSVFLLTISILTTNIHSDKISTRIVLVLALTVGVIGNLLYFFAQFAWMVLLARFLCGFGSVSGVVFGYVGKMCPSEQLTSLLSKVTAISQAGLLLGPCLNFAFVHINFQIAHFQVNALNIPGLLSLFPLLLVTEK
jgi:MFS family permease